MSRIYLAMLARWFDALIHRIWRRGVMRSGMVTGLILAALVTGLFIAYREQGRGNLHKLKAKIQPVQVDVPVARPGGQEAIVLTRSRQMDGSMPEFLSVTMLPGRGMNVLQIAAYIPGKGEVKLLASPTVEGAVSTMTGTGEDADGQASEAMGGAFELPWAGRLEGEATQMGHANAAWRGHALALPLAVSSGGLMLAEAADSVKTMAMMDGGQAQAVFHAQDFGVHWPSKTDVTVTVLLGNQWIELTVTARNTGDTPEPVGIGWHPRFAISGESRAQMRLRIPGAMREEMRDRDSRLPTGRLLPVSGTAYDFTRRGGAALGTMSLDDSFVALHSELLSSGPAAELSDPSNGYGLRLTALSQTIHAMRVVAPTDADFISIGPQFNVDDPFGREWGAGTDTGMVVLQPGQSTEWRVRLELFSLIADQAAK
jgi:galactose mutarotase-like enzyme